MSTLNAIRDTFFEECEDLLEAMVEGLTAIDSGDWDKETVNAVFRAVHSIKGGAGAFGLDDLVGFAHTFETVFDEVRSDKMEVTPDLVQVLFRASDQLVILVESSRDGTDFDSARRDASLAELNDALGACAEPEEEIPEFQAMTLDFGDISMDAADTEEEFIVQFAPAKALFANGHEPARILSHLAEIGTIDVEIDTSELPLFEDIDPDDAYFRWTIKVSTSKGDVEIEEVFEFVEGLCTLSITPVNQPEPDPEPEDAPVPEAAAEPAAPEPAAEVAPSLPTDPAAPAAAQPEAAPAPKQAKSGAASAASAPKATLRVDLGRVDRLINAVGELIINQAMLSQRVAELDLPNGGDVDTELENYKHLARDIQEGVMAIRAQPVKPLFQRMARIVREASQATGKSVELVTSGEGTEVDKTLIEQLSDPLTHIIRNSVDHGIEDAEGRAAAGKPAQGMIKLSATHRSGSIFIEVADDGAGLNRPKILQIAKDKGLVAPDAEMSDSEIDALLFMAGFSTAKQVSNLSGRGVGMDVVKNAIQSLGGRVSIASDTGNGTTLTIILPLTLAVMDGMVVSVADQTLVVPISSVLETVRASGNDLHKIGASSRVLQIRGSYVPIIDVAEYLGFDYGSTTGNRDVLILVETEGAGQCALALDAIHDQRQVVIKSIEGNYGSIPGISAATILGDGKIALILDPESVAQGGGGGGRAPVPMTSPPMTLMQEA